MLLGTFFDRIICVKNLCGADKIETVMEDFKNRGLQATDVDIDCFNHMDIESIVKLHKDFDVKVSSFIYGFDFDYKDKKQIEVIKEATKVQLENCAKLNTPVIMALPCINDKNISASDRLEARLRVLEYLSYLADEAKQYKICATIENHSNYEYPFTYIDDITYLLENVPDIKYVLDTGNYAFEGTDMIEACEKFKDKTVHVHLKDLRRNFDNKEAGYDAVAIGDGELPVFKAIEILDKVGYDGALSVEINRKRADVDLKQSFENLKNKFSF